MCGGGFGKFQNFRHNVETGFGVIPKNSLTGKRVEWESDLENSVSGDYNHGSDALLKSREEKANSEAASKEAAAISEAASAKAAAEASSAALTAQTDEINRANVASEEDRAKRQKSLLALSKDEEDKKVMQIKTNNKGTLLGG